jgi:hypothetical protein
MSRIYKNLYGLASDMSPAPQPKALAVAPIHPVGRFEKTLTEILSR